MPTTSDQQSNETASRRFIVDEPGIDTELGIKGRGYSPDNGQTFIVQHTIDGTVYRLLDAQHLYPLLKPMFDKIYGPVEASLHWANILDKPDLVTESELDSKLSQYTPTAVSWDSITGKPDVALKSDIPTTMSWSQITDKPAIPSEVTSLSWTSITSKPDLALKSDIPQSMTWQQITGKPDVATKDDVDYLKTLIGSSGGSGDAGLTIEAIAELIKHHLKARVDAKTGNLLIDIDDVSNGSIADAVATKVAQAMKLKLQGNELVAEIGGTE